MKRKPTPVLSRGNRNLYCPHYRKCLDYAAKRYWQSWDCFNCAFKTAKSPVEDIIYTTGDTTPYYSLSPELSMKIG